ncbi:MAG: ABC transporter permease [Anaerolineae bacterium]|nr:ABC transporter permease [Anaerolineae bacterium]
MINLRTRKILRDLWGNKIRTALVVLTIAIGVFAVGSIARSWVILSRDLSNSYLAANPASATISTYAARNFNNNVVELVEGMPEVKQAEGQNGLRARVKVGPDNWRALRLVVRDDYDDLRIAKFSLEAGQWPPPNQTMLLERSSINLTQLDIGETTLVELPNGKQREIMVAGYVHDLNQTPTVFSYIAYGYITAETLEKLTGERGFNELMITVAQNPFDEDHIRDVVDKVTQKMEDNYLIIASKEIREPGKHPLDNIIQAVILILSMLGILSVFLSASLVVNIISSILARQVQQIGSLKAIGATSRTIMSMYMLAIVIFGILALIISVPLGMVAARQNTVFIAGLLNFNITSFEIPLYIFGLELLAGLIVPFLAALYPIISGTRITVREAIGAGGAKTAQFGASAFDQLFEKFRGLPTSILYAFRNIFRHKGRLALTLVALSLAGAIFIAVMSVRDSLFLTTNDIAAYWQEDISISFVDPQRLVEVEREALSVPGVARVEGRLVKLGFRVRPNGAESKQTTTIHGVSLPTEFITPTVIKGRWLQAGDTNSLVINTDFLDEEPDLAIGDTVELKIEGRTIKWTVVGLVTSQIVGGTDLMAPIAYTNYDYLAKTMGEVGLVDRLLIRTQKQDIAFQTDVSDALEQHFQRVNLRIRGKLLNTDVRTSLQNVFAIILNLMLTMTLLFATVGGLGLTSMMSLNVLERTQEIGIIRVLGGPGRVVSQIVLTEGIFIGLLSWFLGMLLAIPLSIYFGNSIGVTFLNIPLVYTFPFWGIFLWLVLVIILSTIASLIPARSASRLSVRETLAYE